MGRNGADRYGDYYRHLSIVQSMNWAAIITGVITLVGKGLDFASAGQLRKQAEQDWLSKGTPEPFSQKFYENWLRQNNQLKILALLSAIFVFVLLANILKSSK